jgi:hypothetical protein
MGISRILSLACLLIVGLLLFDNPPASPQEPNAPSEETVVNLAAGRVVIAIVKDAIIVGTVENPIEAETRPPTPVPIGTLRLGVILGAARWSSPSARQDLARLDQELPELRSHLVSANPHLQEAQGGTEATDVEAIGQGLLERLNDLARDNLHSKVDLPSNEPLVELIVADYQPGYGAEVWQLNYAVKQEEQQADYWTTRVLRPSYLQIWPPEKGQPHTLLEFSYPPENAPPSLLDLLRQKDPRLEKITASDSKMTEVADRLLAGDSHKILSTDAVQFLRAALSVISPPNARQTMAIIREQTGFDWILAPPSEPKLPSTLPGRPSDAPTLMGPNHQ